MHTGVIRKLVYGCEYVQETINSVKLVELSHTVKSEHAYWCNKKAGVIRKLVYGCAYVQEIINSVKLVVLSHTVKSEHAYCSNQKVSVWLCVCTGDNSLSKACGTISHCKK